MARGGEANTKRNLGRRVQAKYSSDSDEDYVVSDEEEYVSDKLEDYCSPSDGDELEGSFGSYIEEEMKNIARSKSVDDAGGWRKNGSKTTQKRKRELYGEEEEFDDDNDDDDDDDDYDYEEEEEEEEDVKNIDRSKSKAGAGWRKTRSKVSQRRKRASYDGEEEYEDDDFEEGDVKNIDRPKLKASAGVWRKTGSKPLRKRRRASYDEEEEYDDDYDDEEEEVKDIDRPKPKAGARGWRKTGSKASQRRKRESYDDDDDYKEEEEEEEEEDDEEFAPDENDSLDEENQLIGTKKKQSKKVGKKGLPRKGPVRSQKRRTNTRISKARLQKKGRKRPWSRKKARGDDDDEDTDFLDMEPVEKSVSRKKDPDWRGRRYIAQSDSDFMSSGPSDPEYTISEEEREQIREANELCGNITINLRNLSASTKIQENVDSNQQRKPPKRKGKEKIVEVKHDVGKQVCGICLSEEDKRRVQGTLDCCSHYFCFSCIMEWSKVESRCPLCKQRFRTISKPARLSTTIDLRDVVIPVPERDQVYQPSEEEIRGYLDPYENVICTECHHGGDDGLMLLCDLCDSPAHTYCVGLGQEVPDGNWYCEGCKPIALGSSNSQAQDLFLDQRTTSNMSARLSQVASVRESFDLNSMPSPQPHSTHGFGLLSSPRHHIADVQGPAISPGSRAGAPTLSGRRWIHRHIQNLLSINRMSMAGRTIGISASNAGRDSLNTQIHQGTETAYQPTRTRDIGTSHPFCVERLDDNLSPSVSNRDMYPSSLSHFRGQMVHNPTVATTDGSGNGTLWTEVGGVNSVPGFEQLRQSSSGTRIGLDGGLSAYAIREDSDSHFNVAHNELQSAVRNHLRILSRDIYLDNNTFRDIARSATHTILAACGLEHRISEVYPLSRSSVCSHVEIAGCTSLLKDCCSSCFDSFVRDVVKSIFNSKLPQWLVGSRS